MLAVVGDLPRQVREGYAAGLAAPGLPSVEGVRSIALLGMGGSAFPADLVQAQLEDRLGIPLVVSRGYRLPEFVHTDSLVLALSYSGNTEETVTQYRDAVARGSRVVALCSGGELAARADEDGVARVAVPATFPVPRSAGGYLTAAALGVLEATGLGPAVGADVDESARVLAAAAARWGPEATPNPARDLAKRIGARTPLIWGSEGPTEAVALRWRTEVHENAKRPAFAAAFPELDHNEIEGWGEGSGTGYFLVILRAAADHPSVARRVAATLSAVEAAGLEHEEVWGTGKSPLAQALSLVLLGDYVSAYLAEASGVDPLPTERIDAMKAILRKGA